jgi:hypothetical protein
VGVINRPFLNHPVWTCHLLADHIPLTEACEQKDFVEWRQGRRYFSVWALDLDIPALRQACVEIRDSFSDYWLPGYGRQPHLTVAICGFTVAEPRHKDEDGLADLEAQRRDLLCAQLAPFMIEIGAPGSFASAAYFSVRDSQGGIEKLRCTLVGVQPGADDASFVPHLTFGLYRMALPLSVVLARLQAQNPLQPLQLRVGKLAWMIYEAAVIGGPLRTLGEFDLETGSFNVLAPKLLETFFE